MLSIIKCLKDIANRFNSIFNWVTEEYDSNGWHIIKYRNGWCKLYYRQSFTVSKSGWGTWGSAYVKTIAAIAYPVKFETIPFQSAELQTQSSSGWLDIGWNTVSSTGQHQLNRPAGGASLADFNAWIVYRVYGKLGGVINHLKNWRWSYA